MVISSLGVALYADQGTDSGALQLQAFNVAGRQTKNDRIRDRSGHLVFAGKHGRFSA